MIVMIDSGEMSASAVERRFLEAARLSYRMVALRGPRSNAKIKVLHGWVQDELRRELTDDYVFTGLTPDGGREARVDGMYYGKDVDILATRDGQELGVVSVKFVISNYWQNAVNYFEQQIGETANLRRRNIVYGNLFCLTDPIPYNRSGGGVARYERLRERDVQRYAKLRADHEHAHSPDEMAIGVVELDTETDEITGVPDCSALGLSVESLASLRNELSVASFFYRMARRIELRHLSP